jgi:hypothetical protein
MTLIYPQMKFQFYVEYKRFPDSVDESSDTAPDLQSPVTSIYFGNYSDECDPKFWPDSYRWRGFLSANTYRRLEVTE